MPSPADENSAQIYARIRDLMIREHCDRKDRNHRCAGSITITATDITLQCKLCGDCRKILPTEATS